MSQESNLSLTALEREKVRGEALKVMRQRLEDRRPDQDSYSTESRDGRIIAATLVYAKAAVPVIAVLAALASSVRTVQVVSSIYSAAGSHPVGVAVASLAFTLAAEGALFVLALAQAGESMRRRAERQPRHVNSLASIWRALLVRIGTRPAPRHDELPEDSGGIGLVIFLALVFTLSTNLYLGLKPLIDELGSDSLQSFVSGLWAAPAGLQMTAIVDLTAALFAPLVAFTAGHLTARFASEIAERSQASRSAYERDLTAWREAVADPLSTDEGRELLAEYLQHKISSKRARANRGKVAAAQIETAAPFGPIPPAQGANGNTPTTVHASGHGGGQIAENSLN